jgi:hypothetical protein
VSPDGGPDRPARGPFVLDGAEKSANSDAVALIYTTSSWSASLRARATTSTINLETSMLAAP